MQPTLSEVLKSGTASASPQLLYLAAVLAMGTVGALVTKGLLLFKRSRFVPPAAMEAPDLSEMEVKKYKEQTEELSFLVNELKREKEGTSAEKEVLHARNEELSDQLKNMEDLKQSYEIMYRSNLSLARECDKLKSEKETLVLKSNRPLVKTKTGRRKPAKRFTKKAR